MEASKKDIFGEFYAKTLHSADYLGIGDLKDRHTYKICARNAFVGVWIKSMSAFLISRYKVGPHPYMFFEYHWDTGEPLGTVKPIELIDIFPYEIKLDYDDNEKKEILNYLDELERSNPLVDGVDSLQHRMMSAIRFQQRFTDGKSMATYVWQHYKLKGRNRGN